MDSYHTILLQKGYLVHLMAFENKSSYILFPPFQHCFLVYLFLLGLPTCSFSEPHKNVTLGSSLTATEQHDLYWTSQFGEFAFGFLQLESKGFLLAIWFNKIEEKTVVWSANRDKLAPKGSTIQFTSGGQLVLNDPSGNQIWTPSSSGSTNQYVSYAAMLDSGNFVLAAANSEILWQSFDVPTDTILPSQTLNMDQTLVARYSETNYSSGRFQLQMQSDGNLVLCPRAFPFDRVGKAYWETNTTVSGSQLVFNLTGSINVITKNNTILISVVTNTLSPQNFYLRAIVEHDGIFRMYVYPKPTHNSSMPKAWSQVSDSINICTMLNTGWGIGVCGFNSYCRLGDDQRPFCTCPPRYVLLDPNDEIKSCKPNFVAQSCDPSSLETDNFEFVTLENTNWPQADYGYFKSVSEEWCRNECLNDCFCAVATFRNGECSKKMFPLTYGRMDPSVGGRALLKVRKQNFTFQLNNLVHKQRNKPTIVVIGSVLLGSSIFLNFLLFLLTLYIGYQLRRIRKSKLVQEDLSILGVNLRIFSYEELNKATNGFIHQLGRGSFATVYKGIIDSEDNNNLVAIKKFDNVVQEGDQEFKTEVSAIAGTNHKNLVRFLGFCNEEEHRMLVYEFMHNGSLADFLFGTLKPTWCIRIQLVLGTARGLCYLHEECTTQTIHCDIKPHNILLDDSFTARIADFGLAKLLKKDQTRTLTAIRGTKGYVAPEWFRSLPITMKVDVYSFGILLLEIICCRKSFEEKVEDEEQMVLTDWAYDCFKERKVEILVENDEEAKMDLKRVKKFVMIAIWCIQEDPSLRPTMKKVLQMLEGAIEVSFPPDPSSFISTIL
ncbi:G-type lectin S-receptor-like serine/threonine-protein kinase LECRK3 [Benincasa hispida]|uniref:G-type lectin S-receptor-like serine/threonine-protein kinase LECRK3 n=1 Tax=Benincasa hispida TaxID=102211 RepID=UPI001901AE34|nr:G-type lectin S-receptor-like serine/threonine-protein kinase LECRK3 [Benincasa hispida]